ncbi:MAG: HD domain-containing protein [Desulfobacterota bacterium]|nr:HD domain-containing protein [Thermodesulfobacteriota bacterium]MDW8002580.1 HD domain-containing phosphohydrolase [Deltaproteobacteria bacterium]
MNEKGKYRVAVFSGKLSVKTRLAGGDLSKFHFSVSEKPNEFLLIVKTIRPEVILLDETALAYSPGNLLGKGIDEKEMPFSILFLYLDPEKVSCTKWMDYISDFVRMDELLLPVFEKKLLLHAESQRLKSKVMELETLLIKNRSFVRDLEELILTILDLKVPGIKDRAYAARDLAYFLSEKIDLNEQEKEELTLAALLHEVGKIELPDQILHKGQEATSLEVIRQYRSHALIGRKILSCLKDFQNVSLLVGEQYERFDGEGFPEGLRGNQMSKKALILQAIVFYEEVLAKELEKDAILEYIYFASGKVLDPSIACYLAEYVMEKEVVTDSRISKTPIYELKPGMVIAEDLYSVNGTKILSKGSRITEHVLEIIERRKNVDPVVGSVYVYK